MKQIYHIFISLCIALIMWSCKDSDEIAQPSLIINKTELSFTGYRSTLAVKLDATRRWSAIASDYWISVSPDSYPGANQLFTANVAVTVSDNETGQPREGTVTFFLLDEAVATLIIKQNIQNEEERPDEEFPITWANLQWAASKVIKEGETFEAGSCVFADGVTNVYSESTTGEGIICDIGYSLSDTDPSGDGWTWSPCPFNQVWNENNYYYQGRTSEIAVAGTYYYNFRFRNGDGPYKYAGREKEDEAKGGLWDGITYVNGTFEVKASDEDEYASIDDYSKLSVSWAELGSWTAKNPIEKGEQFETGAQIYIEGLTNLQTGTPNKHVTGEIGYCATNSDPSDGNWIWTSCDWNGQWGDNHYYQGKTPVISTSGTYYYTFRFRIDEGAYVYAGTSGLWNGTTSTFKTFEVKGDEEEDDGIDYSKLSITWANFQWNGGNISVGGKFNAGSKVLISGLTDLEEPATSGNKHVTCEIGYSATNPDPSGNDWTWTTCPWNGDWGNEFYYQGFTPAISEAGTYYYTFRYRIDNGAYVYAGTDGLWNGANSVCETFQVTR